MFAYSSLSALALAMFLGAGVPEAKAFFGGNSQMTIDERTSLQKDMFQKQADLLGLSVDEVKNAWAQGQSVWELAKAKGVNEETIKTKMQTMATDKIKAELKALVDKGIITQAQADTRLAFMQKNIADKSVSKMMGKKGKGKGYGARGAGKAFGHMHGMGGWNDFDN